MGLISNFQGYFHYKHCLHYSYARSLNIAFIQVRYVRFVYLLWADAFLEQVLTYFQRIYMFGYRFAITFEGLMINMMVHTNTFIFFN